MKIVATVEARMHSSRLPGKVLLNIGPYSALELQIKRLMRSRYVDEIVVATTHAQADDLIEDLAKKLSVKCFRGSEQDVLTRILGAARSVVGDVLVQTTGDCPFIDVSIVDLLIEEYVAAQGVIDFISNEIDRTFPIGLDCRVFSVALLSKINKECQDPIHRTHGSTYIYRSPAISNFNVKNVTAPHMLHHPDWRWTLDTAADYRFLNVLAKAFSNKLLTFTANELATFINKNKSLLDLNAHIRQKVLEDG